MVAFLTLPALIVFMFVDVKIVGLHYLIEIILHRVRKRDQTLFVVVEIERFNERASIVFGEHTCDFVGPIGAKTQLA